MEGVPVPAPKPPLFAQLFSKLDFNLVWRVVLILGIGFLVFIFSAIMAEVADSRYQVYSTNYSNASNIYSGEVMQKAPSLNALDTTSIVALNDYYLESGMSAPSSVQRLYSEYQEDEVKFIETSQVFAESVSLISTVGDVAIDADFVKKGLSYQPSFKTKFKSSYTLENTSDEAAAMTFAFPFPANTSNAEISNAVLKVDREEIKNTKAKVYADGSYVSGLKWDGEVPQNGQVNIEVSYDTVGLDRFQYQGFENPKGSQDFNFEVSINGTRSYDVISGLSVDTREFGENSIKLVWEKSDLYTTPSVNVSVGQRLNPSAKVARVYYVMAPLYLIFMLLALFLSTKFQKIFGFADILLTSVLFVVYFPLFHYLSSFTIDPTMEVYASFSNVPYFSMPLYAAFGLAWVLVGGLMYYLSSRMTGFGYTTKYLLPLVVLFLGFFPLVVTIPEYSTLLLLIGVVAFSAVVVQVRINWRKQP